MAQTKTIAKPKTLRQTPVYELIDDAELRPTIYAAEPPHVGIA